MTRTFSLLLALCYATPALAQIWVAPRRPGQTAVRYDDHDWQTVDLLVDADLQGAKAGGVRLLFYEEERDAAERAGAQIEAAYHELARAFDYVPEKKFPYVLYNSYAEFLRSNLFPLQEGTLGVTSTTSLELTLPYFGDHALFTEVGTHEMAHQFTIQKVRSVAKHAEVSRDPLPYLPLWFIEGLAEYYAQGGLSDRNAMLVRDVVTNPDLYLGHGMLDFYDDYPWSVLWTYQVGLARITFLEETYGEGTVQALLEASPWLVASTSAFLLPGRRFGKLVERVTGDAEDEVDAKFDTWIKAKSFEEWLDAEHTPADFDPIEVRGYVNAFDASADGRIVAYRSIEQETGRTRLIVAPTEAPERARRVDADGGPGAESLHPIDPRSFDVEADRIVWVAESRGYDTLVVRELERVVRQRDPLPDEVPASEREVGRPPVGSDEPFAVTDWATKAAATEELPSTEPVERLHLGRERRYRMERLGVVAVYSPSLGPDGRIAFVGLHRDGQRDVFVFRPDGARRELTRLTDDEFAERTLTWHGDQVVFSADATSQGHFDLFEVPADGGVARRLTNEPFDHASPTALPDGRLFFVGWKGDAANLFEVVDGGVVQRTDVAVGLFDPAPGPDGDLLAMQHLQGRRGPVRIDGPTLLDGDAVAQPEDTPSAPRPERDLSGAAPYAALAPRNWRPDSIFGVVAAGPGGVFGQVFASASDLLRDRSLVFSGFFFGSIDLTDGYVLYLDQSRRVTWGGGPFQSLRFRLEETFDGAFIYQSVERYYGGMFSARYPLDRFVYLQLDQSVGAARYFLPYQTDEFFTEDQLAAWTDQWDGVRPQAETTLRLGVDTIRYHYKTGPLAGASLLVEGTGGAQPLDDEVFYSGRADAQAYVPIPIGSGANLGFKASGGTSGGGPVARNFFLSSYDTLRGAYYGDYSVLLGKHFWFANTELQVPLDAIVRTAVASTVEGVAGLDFGGVADEVDALWDRRVLDVAVGGNLVLGPMVFRVHFARAIDIGAPLPVPADSNPWVPNLSLTWLQL